MRRSGMSSNPSPGTDNSPATAVGRIVAAWAVNDADAFAEVFVEDGTMVLPGDVHLTSREQVRTFMREGYEGRYRGSRVTGRPLSMSQVTDDVAIVTTEGGVLYGEET